MNAAPTSPQAAQSSPSSRPLREEEIQKLQRVFASGIVWSRVRVHRLAPFIAMINGSRAFVTGDNVNMPAGTYADLQQGGKFHVLVHEMTHVWQFQHKGWGYVPESLWAQSFGDGYDYVKALRQGKPWGKMNPEQQAQLITDAYRSGYFEAPGALFGVRRDKGAVIRPGEQLTEDFTDYTPVIVAAVEELKRPPR